MGILMSLLKRRNANDLPEDVLFNEILPKLPVKSLMKFKCVSKKWRDFIAKDDLLREANSGQNSEKSSGEISSIVLAKHAGKEQRKMLFLVGDRGGNRRRTKVKEFEISYLLSKGGQLTEDIDVLGSSNGLVLLSKSFLVRHVTLILWNPATKEFRKLPRPYLLRRGIDFEEISQFPILDLGFDEKTNDHKVVRVSETREIDEGVPVTKLNFQVFSKEAGSWRITEAVPGYSLWNKRPGVSLNNGVFYFLALQVTLFRTPKMAILSYRYRDEKVRDLQGVPNYFPDEEFRIQEFDLIKWKKDSLALIAHNQRNGYVFWVMTKNSDDGQGSNWSRLFEFNYRFPVCGVLGDRYLIVQRHHRRTMGLLLWDPKSDGKKYETRFKVVELDFLWNFSSAFSYVPSLVSVYPDHHLKVMREPMEQNEDYE